MKAPVAANSTLVVRAEFTPNDRGPSMTVVDLAGYPLRMPPALTRA